MSTKFTNKKTKKYSVYFYYKISYIIGIQVIRNLEEHNNEVQFVCCSKLKKLYVSLYATFVTMATSVA